MLFCKKCNVEHEEDKRFCPTCGTFLIRKETLLPEVETPEEKIEQPPREKFICPNCKIIYEKTKACIRCGTGVVPFVSFREKETAKADQGPEAEKESSQVLTTREWVEAPIEPLICPVCKKEHLGGKSCIRCGAALVSPDEFQRAEKKKPPLAPDAKKHEAKTPPLSEGVKDLFQDEPLEPPSSKRSVQEQINQGRFLRKVKKDYPRMILNWSGIAVICIAAGYLLWSTYSHVVKKEPDSTAIPPSIEKSPSPAPASSEISPFTRSPTEAEEIEKIRSLLENIRKANLKKDIDLFLSCYSNDFKDREGKKKSMLESWENFNFLDLTFTLGTPTVSGNSARARVEWLVRFSPKSGGPPQESKTILDVVFKKENATWKIREIKSSL